MRVRIRFARAFYTHTFIFTLYRYSLHSLLLHRKTPKNGAFTCNEALVTTNAKNHTYAGKASAVHIASSALPSRPVPSRQASS